VCLVPDPGEEAGVVAGMAGPPPLGLAGLVEVFLAVLADRLQQPVAGLGPFSSATTSDCATRLASSSNTVSGPIPSRPQTSSAASRVQPPANTASRASRACSGAASSWKDQSIVARSV